MTQAAGGRAPDPAFWRGRRVLLTGHSGFKGAWAALWLRRLGAEVHGFALAPDTEPSLWIEAGEGLLTAETRADLADAAAVRDAVAEARPEIVLHLAGQALIRRAAQAPLETVLTNTLGTANLLEALRACDSLRAAVIVTTDKVYDNDESGRAFAESDRLGGDEPYGASKAAAEILTRAWARSWFAPRGIGIATARAGNVIGGGNWSADRLVPDIWRAAVRGEPLVLRAPSATRPWQHVLEPLAGYFLYAEALAAGGDVPQALNFGPAEGAPVTVAEIARSMAEALGVERPWRVEPDPGLGEARLLALDSSLARARLGWRPRLAAPEAVAWTASWYAAHRGGADTRTLCLDQIDRYEALP
ncbi:MAG TPA: CDP-glucose 4,6-dehydratase [Allosphingosinicella sp.]|nr:CDP-glucose 4,6-dehydratase [Allosphingosinicella sp.]